MPQFHWIEFSHLRPLLKIICLLSASACSAPSAVVPLSRQGKAVPLLTPMGSRRMCLPGIQDFPDTFDRQPIRDCHTSAICDVAHIQRRSAAHTTLLNCADAMALQDGSTKPPISHLKGTCAMSVFKDSGHLFRFAALFVAGSLTFLGIRGSEDTAPPYQAW
jgi:hypothetical protein